MPLLPKILPGLLPNLHPSRRRKKESIQEEETKDHYQQQQLPQLRRRHCQGDPAAVVAAPEEAEDVEQQLLELVQEQLQAQAEDEQQRLLELAQDQPHLSESPLDIDNGGALSSSTSTATPDTNPSPTTTTAHPHILLRQRRQGPIVTQLITRATTTITAIVTLGDGPVQTYAPAANPTTTDPGATLYTPLITPPATGNQPSYSSSNVTSNYIGVIVGSVAAFLFIVLLVWFCLIRPRVMRQPASEIVYYSDGSSTGGSWSSDGDGTTRGSRGPRPPQGPPGGWRPRIVLNPPPPRFPPTRPRPGYTQSARPQIRGVRAYP